MASKDTDEHASYDLNKLPSASHYYYRAQTLNKSLISVILEPPGMEVTRDDYLKRRDDLFNK